MLAFEKNDHDFTNQNATRCHSLDTVAKAGVMMSARREWCKEMRQVQARTCESCSLAQQYDCFQRDACFPSLRGELGETFVLG